MSPKPKSKHVKSRRPRYKNQQQAAATSKASTPAQPVTAAPATTTVAAKTIAPAKAPAKAEPMVQYPYFSSELRRIGLITAVIAVILVVLSLIYG